MTTTMRRRLANLWRSLADKSYRDAFVEEHIGSGAAVQIHEIRKARGMTQKELGRLAEMSQDRISKRESGDYGLPNLKTLARLASAFDCGLRVEFVSFSELASWSLKIPNKNACVPPFSDDSSKAAEFDPAWPSYTQSLFTPIDVGRTPVRSSPDSGGTPRGGIVMLKTRDNARYGATGAAEWQQNAS